MPTTLSSCIWLDDRGVAWIDKTNVKVIEVAAEYLAHGNSPEEMCAQHPDTMTLGQIHAALGYYFDHQAEFDVKIERQYQDHVVRLRAAQNSPARLKLRAMGLLK